MSQARSIFRNFARPRRWNDAVQHDALRTYIDNQNDDATLNDHLLHCAREQGANLEALGDVDVVDFQRWDDRTMVELLLDYVENQDSDAAFEDFLEQFQASPSGLHP
jgi:hypothetical protein